MCSLKQWKIIEVYDKQYENTMFSNQVGGYANQSMKEFILKYTKCAKNANYYK